MPQPKIEIDKLWYCGNCGSIAVEYQVWYAPNDDRIVDDVEGGTDETWCNDCKTHPGIDYGNPLAILVGAAMERAYERGTVH